LHGAALTDPWMLHFFVLGPGLFVLLFPEAFFFVPACIYLVIDTGLFGKTSVCATVFHNVLIFLQTPPGFLLGKGQLPSGFPPPPCVFFFFNFRFHPLFVFFFKGSPSPRRRFFLFFFVSFNPFSASHLFLVVVPAFTCLLAWAGCRRTESVCWWIVLFFDSLGTLHSQKALPS